MKRLFKNLIVLTLAQSIVFAASISGAGMREEVSIAGLGLAEHNMPGGWHHREEGHVISPKRGGRGGKNGRKGCNFCLYGSITCKNCGSKNYITIGLNKKSFVFTCVSCCKYLNPTESQYEYPGVNFTDHPEDKDPNIPLSPSHSKEDLGT